MIQLACTRTIRQLRSRGRTGFALGLLVMAAGCGGSSSNSPSPASLRIAAASDLRYACPKLIQRFEQKTGIKATPSFGASGQLSAQIAQGAPFDLLLAANQSFVDDLAEEGQIERDSVRPYARGSLVLAVYRDVAKEVRSLADLTKPVVKKIALANPETAPYGKAAKQALERANLFKQLEPKIVVAESVAQALIYAEKGDAEAALIGRAIAQSPEIRVVEVDSDLYEPIIQALGIITGSKQTAAARAFADFVLGTEGQQILREFGLAYDKSSANAHE